MKTETKTIRGLADTTKVGMGQLGLIIRFDNAKDQEILPLDHSTPCTITLELPVEEKKYEVTASMLEDAWNEARIYTNCMEAKSSPGFSRMKSKLFGGG